MRAGRLFRRPLSEGGWHFRWKIADGDRFLLVENRQLSLGELIISHYARPARENFCFHASGNYFSSPRPLPFFRFSALLPLKNKPGYASAGVCISIYDCATATAKSTFTEPRLTMHLIVHLNHEPRRPQFHPFSDVDIVGYGDH